MEARAALACLGAVLAAAGCGGGSTRSATTGATTEAARPAFSDYQALTSGKEYVTGAFKPALRFTVPRGGWSSEVGDTATDFTVAVHAPPPGMQQVLLAAHRITLVYDPQRGGTVPGDRVALHGSFADWLTRHPRLQVSGPKAVTVMGLSGVQLDVSGHSQPPKTPEECAKSGRGCVPLFYDGFDPVIYTRTSRGRFIVLRLSDGGELVVEEFVEPAAHFARGLRMLQPLLRTLRLY